MTSESLLGWVHFSLGLIAFVLMTLILRHLGNRRARTSITKDISRDRWRGFESLTIKKVIDETPTIRSLVLERKSGKPFPNFRGGQFLSVSIRNSDKDIRSYSFSSSPTQLDEVQISVKRVSGGLGSQWLHQLKVGDEVQALAPSGQFVFDGRENIQVFIAGGVGITPIFSMLLEYFSQEPRHLLQEIFLFYAVRNTSELAFHQTFLNWSRQFPHFHFHPLLSDESVAEIPRGYVNVDLLKKTLPQLGAQYYLCGPDLMTEPIVRGLLASGLSEDQIKLEKFVSATHIDSEKIPERKVHVKFGQRILNYQGRENLLDFLESQGINWDFSCRAGVCGSCRCKVKGQVVSLTNAGLTLREKWEGYALACVTFPVTDIEIVSPQTSDAED